MAYRTFCLLVFPDVAISLKAGIGYYTEMSFSGVISFHRRNSYFCLIFILS